MSSAQTSSEGIVSSAASPLPRLPQEIRKHIYDYALGSKAIKIKHEHLLVKDARRKTYDHGILEVIISTGLPDLNDKSTKIVGLPSWLKSNKQICSEALELLGATWTFTASKYKNLSTVSPELHWPLPFDCPNTLVFNSSVIQNISISKRLSIIRPERQFLMVLKEMKAKDLYLYMVWDLSLDLARWIRKVDLWVSEWSTGDTKGDAPYWNGKLRRVKKVVTSNTAPIHKLDTLNAADALLLRLVGRTHSLEWGGN
jgi:hypothetical protein